MKNSANISGYYAPEYTVRQLDRRGSLICLSKRVPSSVMKTEDYNVNLNDKAEVTDESFKFSWN